MNSITLSLTVDIPQLSQLTHISPNVIWQRKERIKESFVKLFMTEGKLVMTKDISLLTQLVVNACHDEQEEFVQTTIRNEIEQGIVTRKIWPECQWQFREKCMTELNTRRHEWLNIDNSLNTKKLRLILYGVEYEILMYHDFKYPSDTESSSQSK